LSARRDVVLVVALAALASAASCGGAQETQPQPAPARTAPPPREELAEEPATEQDQDAGAGRALAIPHVQQELSSHWCDRGPRTGRLMWEPVPGAVRYEVDEVATARCCDQDYQSWPEGQWRAGRRSIVDFPATPERQVEATYWRVRAVAASGETSAWAYGMWDCWVQ